MKELIQHLSNISDAYDDFILGVINYAKIDTSYIENLNNYMRGKNNLTTSDVIGFIISQPDFHSHGVLFDFDKKIENMKN